MGLDPGYRHRRKVAVVDPTGQGAATAVIYPHEPQRRLDESLAVLGRLAKQHNVELNRDRQRHRIARTERLAATWSSCCRT